MPWYRTGTISVTNNSTAVTGAGTTWVSGVGIGEALYGPDGKIYEIANVVSDTSITLASAYQGTTAGTQNYVIVPSQSYIRDLAAQAAQLVADYGNTMSSVGQGKFADGTLAAPGVRFTSDENTGIRRAAVDDLRLVAGGVDQLAASASGLTYTGGTTKATPVDADVVVLADSAASNILKKLSWANLKAAVKAYYDPVTATLTNKTINLSSNTLTGTLAQFNAAVSDADLVSLAGAETLTNKTLTSPILSNPAITGSISGITDMGEVSLSAISQSLHSGSIVKAIVYDTSKDSDGGAWRKRTTHTSWYNEALGFTGKWLGQKTNLAAAWATSGAAAGDGYQNQADGKFYTLTGTSTASEIFRGNVREFPAVAALVLDATRFVVYDLTQPTCPMWRSFTGVAYTSGAVRDGLFVLGNSQGAAEINFVADTVALRYRASGITKYGPNPVTVWPNTTTNGVVGSTAIVNTAVNDCAITVLDTAPIDAATGLPVPTIAVATAGGVSVIKDDGTVVNITCSNGSYTISPWVYFLPLEKGKFIYAMGYAGDPRVFRTSEIPSANVTITVGTKAPSPELYVGANQTGGDMALPISVTGSWLFSKDTHAGSAGINRLHRNPVTPAKGMIAAITNTYNSGHMVGDIRGAWLADTTAETISGSGELVTNGTFTTDTSGWTANSATAAVVSGEMEVTTAGSGGYYQTFTVVTGRTYSVSATCRRGTSSSVGVWTYQGAFGNGVPLQLDSTSASNVQVLGSVTATGTQLTVYVRSASAGTVYADNISVKLADPDRCVKNKGVIVNGSLTKTAVAAGAGLVAYSGFSDSNYLEQPYNADLDFGTGDFCVMGWTNYTATSSQVFFDRATLGAGRILLYATGDLLRYSCSATGVVASTGVAMPAGLSFIEMSRTSGVLSFSINGVRVFSVANTANVSNASAKTVIGAANDYTGGYPTFMALWRIGATAPSADQIAHIYRTELPLFQANAQCTLAGSSTAVTALTYDDVTDVLHAGTSWGRSSFKDLLRVDSEATSTGALTSLSASSGVILTGGTSGKVYMPAMLLRDELRRKAEARKALGRAPEFFNHTATASQTAFVAPKGYTIKALYHNGTLKREATTGVYWTRSNDGFAETATLSVGASASDWISIMAVRS